MKGYGYKVCYKEMNSRRCVRYFLTYTRRQAKRAIAGYIRYPPRSREDRHELLAPEWKIIPVSRKEFKAGIWRECPF